jgi:hypothetical protein
MNIALTTEGDLAHTGIVPDINLVLPKGACLGTGS